MVENSVPAIPFLINSPADIPDHQLLRLIGRGSYGEVWLARNIMGTWRAVKIIRREAFDSGRPYQREIAGVRRCEPISRAHDGLIDILHIGHNEEAGFFYYVMELADPAGGTFAEETYQPATLAELIAQPGLLPAAECLRLAESMAGALAFLHEQGLIHRDVKPSNILLCGGVPKLADIGLVSATGSSRSFVGTEGFVPREGPGTERADLFALGKVLYEALTGLDRARFPQLPQGWRESPDFAQRVELNEIVLRACEGRMSDGYRHARELLADVTLLASGKSVRKMRGMEGRLRSLKWVAIAATLIALAGHGTAWLLRRERLHDQALEAMRRDSQFLALLAAIRSAQLDPRPGAVTAALQSVREAARLQPDDVLRDEAIVLLNRHDCLPRPDLGLAVPMPGGQYPAVDPVHGLVAVLPDGGSGVSGPIRIDLYQTGRPEPLRRILPDRALEPVIGMTFSQDGRRLLLQGPSGSGTVLDPAGGQITGRILPGSGTTGLLVFCGPGGHRLLRRASGGGLEEFVLPSPSAPHRESASGSSTPPLRNWPPPYPDEPVWPSPDGSRVLLIGQGLQQIGPFPGLLPQALDAPLSVPWRSAILAETASGRNLWRINGPDEPAAAWSGDGSRLAVRCGEQIRVLDAASGQTVHVLPRRIINSGTQMLFPGSRNHLAFNTWSENGLYDLPRGELLGRLPLGGVWQYDSMRHLLYSVTRGALSGATELRPSPVLRIIPAMAEVRQPTSISFDPGERWLFAGCASAFHCWALGNVRDVPDQIYPAPGASLVLFRPGRGAEFLTTAGIARTGWTGQLPASLPAPEPIPGLEGKMIQYAATSRDGRVLACASGPDISLIREGQPHRLMENPDAANPLALSPDGRWLAVGNQHSPVFRLWDLEPPEPVSVWEDSTSPSSGLFTQDGMTLVRSGPADHLLVRWDPDKNLWHPADRLPSHHASLIPRSSATAASSAQSRPLVALKSDGISAAIIDPKTWRTLYHLRSPVDELFEQCILSPSGRYFAAVGTRQEIYVWDLAALGRELTSLGLPPP